MISGVSMEKEAVVVSTKKWIQILIVAGIPLLGFVGVYVIWLALEQNFVPLTQSLVFTGMGLFMILSVIKAIPLLRFVNHNLILKTDGIEIQKGRFSNVFAWNQIGDIKSSEIFQVLKIYDLAGELIYAVDYYADNFGKFYKTINEVYG